MGSSVWQLAKLKVRKVAREQKETEDAERERKASKQAERITQTENDQP